MISLREERFEDIPGIRKVNQGAFGGDVEADIVDALRKNPVCEVSLVAERQGRIVGHIMFSRVELESGGAKIDVLGLAPMAVLPGFQRKGIGSELVAAGLEKCVAKGYGAVVVLGHPEFYKRFGFRAGEEYDIRSEFEVPPGVFLVKELAAGALEGVGGVVRYHKVFSDL